MKKNVFFTLLLMINLFLGCAPKDPSIVKIYVRNYDNILEKDAEVIIVLKSDKLPAYNLTSQTNEFGYATFNLDVFFEQFSSKDEKVADFKAHALSTNNKTGDVMIRPRAHITTSNTIKLEQ